MKTQDSNFLKSNIIFHNKITFKLYILIIYIIFIIISNNKIKKNYNSNNEIKKIDTLIDKNIYKKMQIEKGKIYLNKCLKELLINPICNKIKKPKISVIIPVYNCEKTIISSIRSIQNQNISEIEIILVNDFSKDNTLKIINNLKKVDSRIIIINNNKNMGTLYSRCIGVLNAKGIYLFSLDNDDMFFDYDVFDYIYKIGKEKNFDIVDFNSICAKNYYRNLSGMIENRLSNYPNNLTLKQPDLGSFPIHANRIYNNIHIWAKCIKNEIYKKGVNYLGKKKYSNYMTWAEDISMIFILFNIAQLYKFVDKYGVIHFSSRTSASSKASMNNILFGEIFLLNIIFDFSKNTTDKNLAVYYALFIKRKHKLNKFKNEKNYFLLKIIIKKILNSKYITKNNIQILKDNYKYFI